MPRYTYTAVDLNNNKVEGVVDARDDNDFRKILRSKNLVPIKHKSAQAKASGTYRLRPNEVAEFCRQLANMLGSGVTAVRAIEIIQDRDYKPRQRAVFQKLQNDVKQGITMSEAMRAQGRTFPELLINMFASGEASGQMENVAEKMAVHYTKEHRLNGKIQSATRYPKILASITVIVVLIVFLVVLPNFFTLLEDMVELPLITRICIGFSYFLRDRWYVILIGAFLLVTTYNFLMRIPRIRHKKDLLLIRMPIIGKLLIIIYTARFSRTLSSLYSSGVAMINALEIAGTILNNKYIEGQFPDLIKDIRNGETMSKCIKKIDGFEGKLANTILVGEESGRLDAMLISAAESFDYEAELASEGLVSYAEPVMIVLMAGIIGSVLMAVMLPLMGMYQAF
jgi:type IV pilus assembly protein PilC